MPVGLFRSDGGWVQVDYGTGTTIPVTRSKYEANGYKPDFDKLPSEAEYQAAERRKILPRGPKGEKRPAFMTPIRASDAASATPSELCRVLGTASAPHVLRPFSLADAARARSNHRWLV